MGMGRGMGSGMGMPNPRLTGQHNKRAAVGI